ncbi:MAG: hypothetical protein AAGF28_04935 [Pseudomonadota bacterium]
MHVKWVWGGLLFGLLIGGIMRLPGPEAVEPAFAINLCVMAAIWLGASFGSEHALSAMKVETVVATLTFVVAAIAMRVNAHILLIGFALQAVWCFRHASAGQSLKIKRWFPPFAAFANIGFVASYSLIVTFA